jgi:hygromycin-B 7''-O-kinase
LRLAPNATLGPGGTYPAVVSGDVVIKFYLFEGEWAATWLNERAAQERLRLDDRIKAPRLLGAGELFHGQAPPLPYLILTRIPGVSWCDAPLDFDQRLTVASDLGAQLRLVHALPTDGMPGIDAWMTRTPGEGARSGAFPRNLADQVDDWIETVPVMPSVFVHSDIFDRHPFVDDERLSGVIDWGDAMAADPHVELGKIHLDVFEGDKRLLRAFLEGYGWPVDADFPRRALAMSLRRHTQILGQHGEGGDMFYRLPELLSGKQIDSLDDLAAQLFGV